MATVLIVEDEDSLRETLSRYLTHEGYGDIAAASGYEAGCSDRRLDVEESHSRIARLGSFFAHFTPSSTPF